MKEEFTNNQNAIDDFEKNILKTCKWEINDYYGDEVNFEEIFSHYMLAEGDLYIFLNNEDCIVVENYY